MKSLTLVRHAKSSWKDSSILDHDRGLNKRGKRDACFMAKEFADFCASRGQNPQRIISSSAVRAKLLAERLQIELESKGIKTPLEASALHYTFDAAVLLELLRDLDEQLDTIVLVGHNPAITELAMMLCPQELFSLANIPTSAFLSLALQIHDWSDIGKENMGVKFIGYDCPKNHFA